MILDLDMSFNEHLNSYVVKGYIFCDCYRSLKPMQYIVHYFLQMT